MVLSSRYEQDTLDVSICKSKSRCRGTVSCSENTNTTRDIGICALDTSVTSTWLIAPTATTNSDYQDSETGHKIVIGGALHQKTLSDPVFRCQVLNLWAGGHSHMAQTGRIGTCINPECDSMLYTAPISSLKHLIFRVLRVYHSPISSKENR